MIKEKVAEPALYCLYRITGEPEKDVGKQKLGNKIDAEYKIFVAEELPAARLRGWFSAAAVIKAAEDHEKEPPAPVIPDKAQPFPTDDKNALAEWALKNLELTLDKRKGLDKLIAEVEEANANRN